VGNPSVNSPHVPIVRVRGEADADLPLPCRATPGSAGVDLCAAVEQDTILRPGERALFPTGFAMAIPRGFEGQIRPRSGLALRHGLTLPNAPGTVDSDYRGEIRVILLNTGEEPVRIHRGDRIAQLIVAPVSEVVFVEVETSPEWAGTERGEGGFGHTGP